MRSCCRLQTRPRPAPPPWRCSHQSWEEETPMAAPISILLVDDSPDSRVTLKRLLTAAGFAVAGEAGTGTEGVGLIRETRPDLVVVSLEEPVARPLKSIEALTIASPG